MADTRRAEDRLVREWLRGKWRNSDASAGHVMVRGGTLMYAGSAIAQSTPDGKRFILNVTRYPGGSRSVQNIVRQSVPQERLTTVDEVEPGFQGSLWEELEAQGERVRRRHRTQRPKAPVGYLMRVEHAAFGEGYVTDIHDDMMECVFYRAERTLLYPGAIEDGIVKVVEDRRGGRHGG